MPYRCNHTQAQRTCIRRPLNGLREVTPSMSKRVYDVHMWESTSRASQSQYSIS